MHPVKQSTEQSFVFDEAKAKAKIEATKNSYLEFQGKRGYNPWLSIAADIDPLDERLMKGEKSKELYDAIMSLKHIPDPIASTEPEKLPMATNTLTPTGIKLNPPK